MAGRPRHKRIRASNERNPNPTKLSRKKIVQTCRLCTLTGHNRTTCPNGSDQVPPQGKTPKSRPTSSTNPACTTLRSVASVLKSHHATTSAHANESFNIPSSYTPVDSMGYGCFVDEVTGRTVLNPGMESATVIAEGASIMEINPDAQTKMAIPCERTLRKKLPFKRSCEITRNIRFCGDGYDVREPSALPFQSSGLNWEGN
ncbi:unnamed protein product, partial [Cuscuta epithymum]